MDQIMTGKDLAETKGFGSFREWVVKRAGEKYQKGEFAFAFTGIILDGHDVLARIDCGRWIADCPGCGGAEYVDPEDDFFFCQSCGNVSLAGNARRVVFPKNKAEIEAAVLERPVVERDAANKVARVMNARPELPLLARSWDPGETVEDLHDQNKRSAALTLPSPIPAGRAREEEVSPAVASPNDPPQSPHSGERMEGSKTGECKKKRKVK